MAEDWGADVRRYVSNPDQAAINGLVEYLGVGLKTRKETGVMCGDRNARQCVRDEFLRRTLGLSESEPILDRAIILVCDRMRGDMHKSRVTFYYLLAEKFGKLTQFY